MINKITIDKEIENLRIFLEDKFEESFPKREHKKRGDVLLLIGLGQTLGVLETIKSYEENEIRNMEQNKKQSSNNF